MQDVNERGNPVCPNDDTDMIMVPEEAVETPKNGTIIVGHVGVDSGQVMITDPCYLKGYDSSEYDEEKVEAMKKSKVFDYSYSGACAKTLSKEQAGEIGLGEQGVVSSSGYGDGQYPVYATYQDGRVKSLMIKFF